MPVFVIEFREQKTAEQSCGTKHKQCNGDCTISHVCDLLQERIDITIARIIAHYKQKCLNIDADKCTILK